MTSSAPNEMNDLPQFLDAFADETSKATRAAETGEIPPVGQANPAALAEYLDLSKQNLGQGNLKDGALLNAKDLEGLLDDIDDDSELKYRYPEGSRVCVAIVPFDNYGYPLTAHDVSQHMHVRVFVVDSQGITLRGLVNGPSRHYDLLPAEIKESCTSQPIHYPVADVDKVTKEDRDAVKNAIRASFVAAQEIFNQPTIH